MTDAAEVEVGMSSNDGTTSVVNTSSGSARTTIAGSKAFRIEHQVNVTTATSGFGNAANFGTEQYTTVEIFKEA